MSSLAEVLSKELKEAFTQDVLPEAGKLLQKNINKLLSEKLTGKEERQVLRAISKSFVDNNWI